MRKNSRYLKYKYGAEKMKTGSFLNNDSGKGDNESNLLGFSMEPI